MIKRRAAQETSKESQSGEPDKVHHDVREKKSKEKGVDGFVRQGKFTDDGQEWNQKLHRHCEGGV